MAVRIAHRRIRLEARRLVTDQAHAVRQEIEVAAMLRLVHQRLGCGVDRLAGHARLHRVECGALDGFDLTEVIDELGIRLAVDRHAADVADVAVVVAAGIERQDIALAPDLIGRRTVEAGAGGDEAILEGHAAVGFLAAQRFDEFLLGGARSVFGDHRRH